MVARDSDREPILDDDAGMGTPFSTQWEPPPIAGALYPRSSTCCGEVLGSARAFAVPAT